MEDFELIRRLRKFGRIVIAPAAAVTSARRWRDLGIWRTTLINQAMILGYLIGISPARLAKWYRGNSPADGRNWINASPGDSMTQALVTGGTGFIGSHMVELLLAEGWQVVCPVRNPHALRYLEGLPVHIVPLDRLKMDISRFPDIDYVIHIAGATPPIAMMIIVSPMSISHGHFLRFSIHQLPRSR